MSLGWLISTSVGAVLLPPLNLVLAAVFGWWLSRRHRRTGIAVAGMSLMLLILLSVPFGSRLVIAPIEWLSTPLVDTRAAGAQAIVVLGGGRAYRAPEYGGGDTINSETLVRLRYAAKLHRETSLPILVTGGMPDGRAESEASLMAHSLREDFRAPVKWQEGRSDNTAQNAFLSAAMLQPENVRRILLVTDAMHMPRATRVFREAGFDVVQAPTMYLTTNKLGPADFVPNARTLARSHYAMHEWIGMAWYWLRHGA